MTKLLAGYRVACGADYISPSHRRDAIRQALIDVYKQLIRRHGAEAVVRHGVAIARALREVP